MNSETAQFGESIATALELAALSKVSPLDIALCLGGYIDITVRCAGGSSVETAQLLRALSKKYAKELPSDLPIGRPVYSPCSEVEQSENARQIRN